MREGPRTCNSCQHWSPYAPGLGECLVDVKRRLAARARWPRPAHFDRAWPPQPAPDTEHTDSCDQHEPLP